MITILYYDKSIVKYIYIEYNIICIYNIILRI